MNPPTRSEISGLAVPSMVSGLNLAGVPIAACKASAIPKSGAFHGAEVEGDRLGPCRSMMSFSGLARSSRRRRSTWCPACRPSTRAGQSQTVRMVVQLRQRTDPSGGLTARERVVMVAVDADHLVPVDVDENAADGGADTAEATHRLHTPKTYSRFWRSTIT